MSSTTQPCLTCGDTATADQKEARLIQGAINLALTLLRSEGYTGNIIIHKRVNGSYGYRKPDQPRGNKEDIQTVFIN